MQHFRYRDIEAALVAVLQIPQEKMGAFRARLRHLRAQGVPDLPGTGKGTQAQYSWQHAFQMLLALELENLGKMPQPAAMLACSIVRVISNPAPASGDHVYAAFSGSMSRDYEVIEGEEHFSSWVRSAPRGFSRLDLTACVKALEAALANQIGQPARYVYARG